MSYSFDNKVALVTGGSSGLGKATAIALKNNGCKVMITGRNESKLVAVAKEFDLAYCAADVSSDADIERMYQQLESELGSLDILINNAGISSQGWATSDELTRDDFQRVFDVNVFGAAMVASHAAKIFKEKKQGVIINIASTAALKGFARGSVYASSKFALRAITQCFQAELRPFNVRVIGVNPSEVPTAFNQADRVEKPLEDKKLTPEEISHSIITAIAMDERGFIPEFSVWATNPF